MSGRPERLVPTRSTLEAVRLPIVLLVVAAVVVGLFCGLTTRRAAWYELRTSHGPKAPRRWRFGAEARRRRGK